jgi:hypothetical protein
MAKLFLAPRVAGEDMLKKTRKKTQGWAWVFLDMMKNKENLNLGLNFVCTWAQVQVSTTII